MKLIYIFNSRMPIELAHGLQVMQMSSAFAENGCEVELMIPKRVNPIKDDPFSYYDIEKTFSIKKIPCLDLIFLSGKNIFFWVQTLSFLFCAKIYLMFRKYDILYTREQMTAFLFSNFVLEIHLLPKKTKSFHLYVWKKARRLVVLTPFIKDRLVQTGISAEKIIVSPDGVNLSLFDIPLSKEEAREKLNLPKNKKLVGYVGMLRTLGMEKGVDVLIKAFAGLKEKNSLLILVGGYKDDIDFYKNMSDKFGLADRVVFVGKVAHNLVPVYLKAFDCLVAPFPKNEHYSFFMSPMKIFEYMASGRPIVSTKLLSLVEILGDGALLVEPDSAEELKNGIGRVLEDEKFSEGLVTNAYNNVLNYTWQKRAKNILGKIR